MMQIVKRVSVVTVCLNERDTIRLTLESVRSQSFPDIEHVVIDGISKDGTIDIVREYEQVHLISELDKDLYDAMDKGAKVATGDIVIFLNAGDTFFDQQVCTKVASFFDETRADIVFGNLLPVYLRPDDSHDHGAFEPGKILDLGYVQNRGQLYNESIHHQATWYRNWVMKKCSFACPDKKATGEYNLLLDAVFNHEAQIKHIPETISRFALGGISTGNFKKEWKKYIYARDLLRARYFPNGRPDMAENQNEFVHSPDIENSHHASVNPPPAPPSGSARGIFRRIYGRIINSVSARLAAALMPYFIDQIEGLAARNDAAASELSNKISALESLVGSNGDRNEAAVGRTAFELSNKISELGVGFYQLLDQGNRVLKNQASLNFSSKNSGQFRDHGFKVFSQWDEDGLLRYLIERIPECNERFIEFGVGDYTESNTRLLLELHGWSGLVMDCDEKNIRSIREAPDFWRYNLEAVEAFLDRDNINGIIAEHEFDGEIGILSIDVDGMDYWIWEALDVSQPQIVVCEYNGAFGSSAAVTVPYRPDFDRFKASPTMIYAGASLNALAKLGRKKGYTLVGTNIAGNNGFFIRNDVLQSSNIQPMDEPFRRPLFRESRDHSGALTFMDVADSLHMIADLPLIDVTSQETIKVSELDLSFKKSLGG